jgi:hypothetical protein
VYHATLDQLYPNIWGNPFYSKNGTNYFLLVNRFSNHVTLHDTKTTPLHHGINLEDVDQVALHREHRQDKKRNQLP